MSIDSELTQQQLEQIYNWIDQIPLSRPKRNISRDFSDAVLFAEIIDHYNPKIIDLHNYITSGSIQQKEANWNTLNRKVLTKLKIAINSQQIKSIANCQTGVIQKLILNLKKCIQNGQIPSPSQFSKSQKSTNFQFNSKKQYHKLPFSKKQKDVHQLLNSKDSQINCLKQQISMLLLKTSKLEEMIKCKDHQIDQFVTLIKNDTTKNKGNATNK